MRFDVNTVLLASLLSVEALDNGLVATPWMVCAVCACAVRARARVRACVLACVRACMRARALFTAGGVREVRACVSVTPSAGNSARARARARARVRAHVCARVRTRA
jgi:hypothetical protein